MYGTQQVSINHHIKQLRTKHFPPAYRITM